MEKDSSLNDKIRTREESNTSNLGINESLLKIISAPLYGNAKKDFYDAFYDESKYYEDLIKGKKELCDYIYSLNPEDSIYQLNSKALISMNEHPELSQGRIENVFNFSEDVFEYYDDEDEYSEDYSDILLDIEDNYKKAISRHSDYSANLKRHIANGYGLVYSPFINDESVLVGQLQGDIFLVSHFAPSSMRMGYFLIKQALNSKMPIIFTVPESLAKQLRKAGFTDLGYQIPQIFNGEIVMKNVLINNAVTKDDIKTLAEKFSNNYLGSSI